MRHLVEGRGIWRKDAASRTRTRHLESGCGIVNKDAAFKTMSRHFVLGRGIFLSAAASCFPLPQPYPECRVLISAAAS